MFGWIEIGLLSTAAILVILRLVPRLRPYRPLFTGGGALLLITAVFPRTGNPLGQFLFGVKPDGLGLPRELFGVVWWVLGAWLFKSLLDLVLRRTFFPNNNEPHARRLFADLASGLIYVLAFGGIVGTVFKEPISTFLATSGVVAIVLGLALQNTLGNVFAGLAINIERPFRAGDWITVGDKASGQVTEVNWRATRINTLSNDTIVMPNSVIAMAAVTNHSRPKGAHDCVVRLSVDLSVKPSRVIEALTAMAGASPDITAGTVPLAYACAFADSLVVYELAFKIDSFAQTPGAKSRMLLRIADAFQEMGIQIGAPPMDVRLTKAADFDAPHASGPCAKISPPENS